MTAAEHMEAIKAMTSGESEGIERNLLYGIAQRFGQVADAERNRRESAIKAAHRRAVGYTKGSEKKA